MVHRIIRLSVAFIVIAAVVISATINAADHDAAPSRVVSLSPEATEIICLLGADANLVGIVHQDSHFPGIDRKSVV